MLDFSADSQGGADVPGITLTECEKHVVSAVKMIDESHFHEAREELMNGMMNDIECISALLLMRFLRIDHSEIFGETDLTSDDMLSRVQKAPEKSREQAKKLLEYLSKAFSESPTALFLCGSLEEKVFSDLSGAINYYKASGERGCASAQFNLGCFYNTGTGVEVDKEEAAKWFQLAADQNRPNAQNNLGVLYLTGQGVEMDRKKASDLFRAAAKSGHVGAKQNLVLALRPIGNVKLPTSAAKNMSDSPVESPREQVEPWIPGQGSAESVPLTGVKPRKKRGSFSIRFFGGQK